MRFIVGGHRLGIDIDFFLLVCRQSVVIRLSLGCGFFVIVLPSMPLSTNVS